MSRILVTIEAGGRRLDAAVPPHLTSLDLLAWIGRTMGPFDDDLPRSLTMPDGSNIDNGACLGSVGVVDGMTLRAVAPGTAAPPHAANQRQTGSPDLPVVLSTFERLLVTARALRGHLPGRDSPWDRAVNAWKWTDHERRLRWLITRPAATPAPTISVSGHRSTEIGEQLALAFASIRTEPVVLVDGDPAGGLSRHLEGSRSSWEAIARDLTDPALGRLQRDRLLARSPAGIPLVSAVDGIPEHIEKVVHALSRRGAIVIVDEGHSPPESPVGDQAVISAIGKPPITTTVGIIAAWGSEAATISDRAAPHVPMDGRAFRMLELAALLAGRWPGVGAPESDHGELG